MKIIMFKRNLLSALIVNYLSVEETECVIYWSHICSDLMGDLISFDKVTIWEGDRTQTSEHVQVSNGLWIDKDLFEKHKDKIEDQNYLLNFSAAVTPYNNKAIRERLFNV